MSTLEEADFLLECWEQKICPQCHTQIHEMQAVGDGAMRNGRFCSLDCYTRYHEKRLIEKHRNKLKNSDTNH